MTDNRLVRVLTALCCDVWLLPPAVHATLTDIARRHAEGGEAERAQHEIAAAMKANPGKRQFDVADTPDGAVAVIPVEGIIGRKFSSMLYDSGVTSVDVLQRMIGVAADDEQVAGIVLSTDSPGGYTAGVPEAAEAIRAAAQRKPVIAYADGLMGSAAYWLGSQASAIYATPSAEVGSVGAYIALLDRTREMEMSGLRVDLFRSGKHKGMGYPGTILSDEQRAMLQARVDATGAQFRAAVRDGRSRPISDDVMQGQSFGAAAALANGLVDSVGTLDAAIRDAAKLARMRR